MSLMINFLLSFFLLLFCPLVDKNFSDFPVVKSDCVVMSTVTILASDYTLDVLVSDFNTEVFKFKKNWNALSLNLSDIHSVFIHKSAIPLKIFYWRKVFRTLSFLHKFQI